MALTAGAAAAGVPDSSLIETATVAPLMAWVEQQTGTHVPTLPQVIASRTRLIAALQSDSDHGPIGRPQSGYIPGTVIMDHVYWDEDDEVELSLLVHELVHHAQLFMTNTHWACPDAREEQAYTLQNKWLAEHGHRPFVDAAWIARVSSCGDQNNPSAVADTSADTPHG